MPIEFQCTHCQNVLKVGDEHAGKSARCPSCKAVTAIPLDSEVIPGRTSPPTDSTDNPFVNPKVQTAKPDFDADNPYRAPASGESEKRPVKGRPINPTSVTFDEIFSYAWDRWKNNLAILIGMTVIVLGASYALAFAIAGLEIVLRNTGVDNILIAAVSVVLNIASYLVNMFLAIGQIKICLNIARQRPAEITQLFSGGDKLLPYIGATILFGIAFVIGIVLLIIPGILLWLYYWPYMYLIVDDKTKAMQSFEVAPSIAGKNIGTFLVLTLASIGIAFVGLLMCGVGLLVAIPLINMMLAVAYLKMSGQI